MFKTLIHSYLYFIHKNQHKKPLRQVLKLIQQKMYCKNLELVPIQAKTKRKPFQCVKQKSQYRSNRN